MNFGLLVLRVVVGALFIGHGTQKLFGWFGGSGPEGTGQFFHSLGFRPGRRMAILGGTAEAGSGSLLLLGFLTPLAAAGIIGVMMTASMSAHAGKGVWNSNGGYELPLAFGTAATALAFTGPGSFSVDHALGWSLSGAGWGIFGLFLGMAAALAMHGWRTTRLEEEELGEERRAA